MPKGMDGDDRTLADLLSALENAAPADRMDLREAVLGFGSECIGPLRDLATRVPYLAASASAWLETLASRDPSTKADVVRALSALARGSDGGIAREALARLGAPPRSDAPTPRKRSTGPSATQAAVHARIIRVAEQGGVIAYSELANRRHLGRYLLNISVEEASQDHPPLTSIVVSKTTGRPGDGFLPAMIEVGFAHEGEKLDDVWGRAVAAVHSFWQGRKDG